MLPLVIINVILACTLLAFVCIIWILGSRIKSMDQTIVKRHGDLERRVEEIGALVRELSSEIEAQKAISAARVPAASINLNKRNQALTMLRRRETPESIAAALDFTMPELQLLMKVQDALELAAHEAKSLAVAK